MRYAALGKLACLYVGAMAWRSRRRSLRMAGSLCALVAGVATLLLVAGGIFVMRLSHSPIVIEGLGARIAAALDEKFGHGYRFALGQTAITKHGYGPTLGIDGLTLKGSDDQTIFSAPYAEVSVDPFALIIGRVTPKRLDVLDVQIKLSVLPNGALTVSTGSADANTPSLVVPPRPLGYKTPDVNLSEADASTPAKVPRAIIIKQAAAAMRLVIDTLTNPDSSIAAIDHVGIKRGRLEIDDRTTDETTVFNGLDLAFDKSGGVTNFHLSAEGPNGRWMASVKASGAPGSERHMTIAFDNISLDEISLASGVRNLGVDFDMPVSTQFDVTLTPEGAVSKATGQFKMNAGYFRLDDPDDEPLLIDTVDGHFHWEPSTRLIIFDKAEMKAGGTHFAVAGTLKPPVLEDDAFALDFHLAQPGVHGAQRPGEKPITIEHATLAAKFKAKEKHIAIERLSFDGADFGLALAGDVDWLNGPHIRLGASLAPSPVRTVARLWPSFMAAPVRSWFLAHFLDGTISNGTLRVDLDEAALAAMKLDRPPPDDASTIDLTVSNGSLNFLPGVPPLHDINGVAHILGRSSTFTITNGALDTDGGHRLSLSEGSFRIADASIKPTPAVMTAKVTGSMEAVKDLLSYDAFKSYASMPVDSNVRGQVEGRLEIDMKIAPPGSNTPDPLILINANTTNLVVEKLIGKEKLDSANMTVNVDANGLKATGQGHIFGVPATLELSRPLGSKLADATLSFTTDDATRQKQGLPSVPGINGPITTRISTVMGGTDKPKALIELDLTKTVLDGALLGLTKPAGASGKASFSVSATDDSAMQIDQIAVDVGAIQLRGSVELAPDQSLLSAKLSQVRLSPGDDMKVDVNKAGETVKVTVRASTIDARPFLKSFAIAAPGSAPAAVNAAAKEFGFTKNIDLDLKCGLVTGYNKRALSNVDLRLVKQNDLLRQFALSGHFGREALSSSMASGSSQLKISSQDAGSLLSFVDLYRHMEGGELWSELQLAANESMTGGLVIKDFTLRDEPAMRRLVAAGIEQAAPNQDPSRAMRIDADSVPFKKLQVWFQRSGSRLELRDGTMYGAQIGLTVAGLMDFTHDRVNLNGTFVPAYELNNLFSQIPVVGPILGGGANEGLFGVNYNISGLASAPTLNINPLSALTPGFMRGIFSAIDPANLNNPQLQAPVQMER